MASLPATNTLDVLPSTASTASTPSTPSTPSTESRWLFLGEHSLVKASSSWQATLRNPKSGDWLIAALDQVWEGICKVVKFGCPELVREVLHDQSPLWVDSLSQVILDYLPAHIMKFKLYSMFLDVDKLADQIDACSPAQFEARANELFYYASKFACEKKEVFATEKRALDKYRRPKPPKFAEDHGKTILKLVKSKLSSYLVTNLYAYQAQTVAWMMGVEQRVSRGWSLEVPPKTFKWPGPPATSSPRSNMSTTTIPLAPVVTPVQILLDPVTQTVSTSRSAPELLTRPKRLTMAGGLLADTVGLGKTLTCIALALAHPPCPSPPLYHLREGKIGTEATLIFCPSHLARQWATEIAKHCKRGREAGGVKVVVIATQSDHQKASYGDFVHADFVVVSLAFLLNPSYRAQGATMGRRSLRNTKARNEFAQLCVGELLKRVNLPEFTASVTTPVSSSSSSSPSSSTSTSPSLSSSPPPPSQEEQRSRTETGRQRRTSTRSKGADTQENKRVSTRRGSETSRSKPVTRARRSGRVKEKASSGKQARGKRDARTAKRRKTVKGQQEPKIKSDDEGEEPAEESDGGEPNKAWDGVTGVLGWLLKLNFPVLSYFHFRRIILDEGHELARLAKGMNLQHELAKLASDTRWFLSATPFPTPLSSARCLFRFLEASIDGVQLVTRAKNESFDRKDSVASILHTRVGREMDKALYGHFLSRCTKDTIGDAFTVPPCKSCVVLIKMSPIEKYMSNRCRPGLMLQTCSLIRAPTENVLVPLYRREVSDARQNWVRCARTYYNRMFLIKLVEHVVLPNLDSLVPDLSMPPLHYGAAPPAAPDFAALATVFSPEELQRQVTERETYLPPFRVDLVAAVVRWKHALQKAQLDLAGHTRSLRLLREMVPFSRIRTDWGTAPNPHRGYVAESVQTIWESGRQSVKVPGWEQSSRLVMRTILDRTLQLDQPIVRCAVNMVFPVVWPFSAKGDYRERNVHELVDTYIDGTEQGSAIGDPDEGVLGLDVSTATVDKSEQAQPDAKQTQAETTRSNFKSAIISVAKKQTEQQIGEEMEVQGQSKTIQQPASFPEAWIPTEAEVLNYGSRLAYLSAILADIVPLVCSDPIKRSNRVILFSQYSLQLNRVKQLLDAQGYGFFQCQGNVMRRNKALKDFYADDTNKVLLLSLEQAASGTNLQQASHVVLLDPIPGTRSEAEVIEGQAIGRAHRQGQDKAVTVVRLAFQGTSEEKLVRLATRTKKRIKSAQAAATIVMAALRFQRAGQEAVGLTK